MSKPTRPGLRRCMVYVSDTVTTTAEGYRAQDVDALTAGLIQQIETLASEVTELRYLSTSTEKLEAENAELDKAVTMLCDERDWYHDKVAELEAALRKIKALHHCMATRVLDVIAIIDAALEKHHE